MSCSLSHIGSGQEVEKVYDKPFMEKVHQVSHEYVLGKIHMRMPIRART